MKNNLKTIFLVASAFLLSIMMCIGLIQHPANRAISMEEAIHTAKSDIKIREKNRLDKVGNLADCVMQYDKHEAEVLQNLAESRTGSAEGENISNYFQAVAESYPELQSSGQYQVLMLDLITIENEISQYREAYNKEVERYNGYVKKFPQRILLKWTGYEVHRFERFDFNAPEDAPEDLFGE